MAASNASQPPRFVVQCAKGRGWKTLVADFDPAAAEAAFREVVKINPRGCFRLIRLEHKPEDEGEGMAFDWKLLALHDPRTRGATPHRRRAREKLPLPWRLYLLVALLGAILAALLYLALGPELFGAARGR
jgi:hypothetical protein